MGRRIGRRMILRHIVVAEAVALLLHQTTRQH
jgi:hypothetical protein